MKRNSSLSRMLYIFTESFYFMSIFGLLYAIVYNRGKLRFILFICPFHLTFPPWLCLHSMCFSLFFLTFSFLSPSFPPFLLLLLFHLFLSCMFSFYPLYDTIIFSWKCGIFSLSASFHIDVCVYVCVCE